MYVNEAIICGEPAVVIRDNAVVGKCQVALMRGSEWAGIRMLEGQIVDDLASTQAVKMLGLRHCYFHYDPLSGTYLGGEFTDAEDHDPILENTRVVSAFHLRWGMVPETFKDVEGYRAGCSENEVKA